MNDMREKMVELIRQIVIPFWAGQIADHLISNDVVPVVRCKDCVLHGECLTEDTFNLCRIENPFCCAGKRKDGEG